MKRRTKNVIKLPVENIYISSRNTQRFYNDFNVFALMRTITK